VILPDSLYHGERGSIDYEKEVYEGVFWKIVLKNIEEYDIIKDFAIDKLNANPNRMAVMGHSMGGFTSSGIFSKDVDLKTAIIVNGSCDYLESNEIFKKALRIEDDD
jgi:Dipeptidyl aminopeptidases/acylaminoacyl-peptidases